MANTPEETNSYSRFLIARDVADFVERENGTLNAQSLFDVYRPYDGGHAPGIYDAYERLFFSETQKILSYYPHPEWFLQNLDLDEVLYKFEHFLQLFDQALVGELKPAEKSLIFVHLPPLEMALLALILDEYGIKNITLNFNRAPLVNSASKTLEAHMILTSARANPRFYEQIRALTATLSSGYEMHDVLIDENDTHDYGRLSSVESYIAQAIGLKNHQVILRVDEYPREAFLRSQAISHVYIVDIDTESRLDDYYRSSLESDGISVKRRYLPLGNVGSIGVYEDYVLRKNDEFLQKRAAQREKIMVG